jgi:septal ring factor EnvC (AmiA/AmiB activator)
VGSVQEQQAEAQMAMATADTGVPTLVEVPQETSGTTPTVQINHREQSGQADHVSLPVAGERQLAAELASQYEALTRELREVHQKSNEIEHKLSLLNEMATRFERMQDGHDEDEIERMRMSEREINTETDLRPTPSRVLDPYR